jgi:hypothetical protein
VSGISTGATVLSMPGVAAEGAAGTVAAGEDAGDAAAPARAPDADEPSPPPQPANARAAAMEMQCSFALSGKRIFNPLLESV